MKRTRKRVLGIEGGGTKTEWIYADLETGKVIEEGRLPAANFKLIAETALRRYFLALPNDATHIGIFLAGCGTATDRTRLLELARDVWPGAQTVTGSDRESGFATAFRGGDGITVIAGTGSAITGRRGKKFENAGGWGQLLGDIGGGYDLALQALRLALFQYDTGHLASPLGEAILRELALNRLEDLVDWARVADKMSVAKLAPVVFRLAREGVQPMIAAIEFGARALADYTSAVAQRLGMDQPPVKLLGGLFAHHPEYLDLFCDYLSHLLPGAKVELCTESGAVGAAWLAEQDAPGSLELHAPAHVAGVAELAAALTEQRNPRSENLDRLSTPEIVELFISEEKYVTDALGSARESLGRAIDLVSAALRDGGRLFYIGAGTSGRLGVLDASEIPPTFGAPPDLVQGIIAGGAPALHRSVEGAEDQDAAGAATMRERGVKAGDVVCGIAASGRTPFVLGALREARAIGAKTVLLTCNPARRHDENWDVEIDLPTGPELVTGSTRLKAGTATKLALNLISTAAMIRLGKVRGNSMVDLAASNAKLRDRAIRLVSQSRGCSADIARALLERHAWNVRACLDAPSA